MADNKRKNKGRHPVLKKILIILGVLLAAMLAACVIYVSNYYHANDEAIAALQGCEGVSVTTDDNGFVTFAPDKDSENSNPEDLHTGLIFYPGGKVEYTAYAPLMEDLALNGVTCVLVKVPCNLAFLNLNAADGIIAAHPEVEHWYIGGHSLGGVAAAMYLSKGHTEEYDGIVLLGSYSSVDLTDTTLRVLCMYGENDGVLNREQYENAKVNLPADVTEVVIPGGCHAYFGSYGEQKGDGQATITPQEQQQFTAETIAGWMK